tara:strand:+ start:3585 stop:3761 length:177 start_codon:yes stop_codon:yes gene_type:complete
MSTPATFRLPKPPSNYNEGFMNRLINALELDKKVLFFAASTATKNLSDEAQSVSWFMS